MRLEDQIENESFVGEWPVRALLPTGLRPGPHAEALEHLTDSHILHDGPLQRLIEMELILIDSSDALLREIALRFKLGEDAMNEPFGPAQYLGDPPGRE